MWIPFKGDMLNRAIKKKTENYSRNTSHEAGLLLIFAHRVVSSYLLNHRHPLINNKFTISWSVCRCETSFRAVPLGTSVVGIENINPRKVAVNEHETQFDKTSQLSGLRESLKPIRSVTGLKLNEIKYRQLAASEAFTICPNDFLLCVSKY